MKKTAVRVVKKTSMMVKGGQGRRREEKTAIWQQHGARADDALV